MGVIWSRIGGVGRFRDGNIYRREHTTFEAREKEERSAKTA
jgi:hypothetical protein